MTEVLLGCEADLRPFKAGEGDDIGLSSPLSHGIALPHRIARHLPSARIESLRVVGQRVEVELRAEAREVAGIGGRVNALPAHQRKTPHEGVDRERGVNMQVAKEDAIGAGGCALLTGSASGDVVRRERLLHDLAVKLLVGPAVDEPKSQDEKHQAENDGKTALFPPSHAGASIGRDAGVSR